MAQGSRFVAPRFNGPGLWDPRVPGEAYPEPKQGQPYVEGVAGCCGGGMGAPAPFVGYALNPHGLRLATQMQIVPEQPASSEPATPASVQDSMTIQPEPPAKSNTKKYLYIGLGVVGLGLIAFGLSR